MIKVTEAKTAISFLFSEGFIIKLCFKIIKSNTFQIIILKLFTA